MSKFIELTIAKVNKPMLFNVDLIENVFPSSLGCFVTSDFDRNGLSIGVDVVESYDKVKSMLI